VLNNLDERYSSMGKIKSVSKKEMAKKPEKKVDLNNIIGYNVKSKKKEKILDAKLVTMKNGRKAVKGKGKDGTGMYRIL
jgi:hypothetical protein